MSYPIPDLSHTRAAYLRDLRNVQPDADVDADSDHYVRATALASAVEGLYQHQSYLYRQIFADTADTPELERHAGVRGIYRKAATRASGSAAFTGTQGTPVAAGTVMSLLDGRRYQTLTAGVIGAGGTVTLTVEAVEAGSAGIVPSGWQATLQAPPLGIDSQVTLGLIAGGTDIETDAALLERLLDLIRRPPAGGNQYDYRRWALEVPGVTAAFVYPQRHGLGTLDIVITSGDGLPSALLLQQVYDHINALRPVRSNLFRVIAPTLLPVNVLVRLTLDGVTLADATVMVNKALAAIFAPLAPGDVLVRSQVEAAISNLPGVKDRQLFNPMVNVQPISDASTIQWCRLGTVQVELL